MSSTNKSFNSIFFSRLAGFKPGRAVTAFSLLFLPIFLSLGLWQLNRAEEKTQTLASAQAAPVTFDQIRWADDTDFRRSQLVGRVMEQPIFLLDNKTYLGKAGFEVFVLVETDLGLLGVSLGWQELKADRSATPMIHLPDDFIGQQIQRRNAPTNPVFDEAAQQPYSNSALWLVQGLSREWLSEQFNVPVLGFAQLLDSAVYGVGPNVWQPSTMTPQKHRAYAVQWFAMAVALLIMFVYAGLKRDSSPL